MTAPEMPSRVLGKTGEHVSAIGLGGWHIGLKRVDEPLALRIVITGIDSMEILEQAFEAARTFRPLNEASVSSLLAKTASAASKGEFELFKTTSIFDATATNPTWLGEEPERVQKLVPFISN